jgi:hypothetical protein
MKDVRTLLEVYQQSDEESVLTYQVGAPGFEPGTSCSQSGFTHPPLTTNCRLIIGESSVGADRVRQLDGSH